MSARLPDAEYDRRLTAVRDRLDEVDADAAAWFGATSIAYLTGFHHIQTERPVCLVVTPTRVEITVPRLERDRAAASHQVDRTHLYFDYPGGDPLPTIAEMLANLAVGSVAADADGAPGTMGYEGPPLSDFVAVDNQDWVKQMRYAKSDAEIGLIRESARWGHLGHQYLADIVEPGGHPASLSQKASLRGSRAMLDTLGAQYVPRVRGGGPVQVGFISGPQTALPHGHTANRKLERGDVIITGASAIVDGYRSELERTMFVGEPDDDQIYYFELMLDAQNIALDAIEPGVPVADVDRAVWDFYQEQGVTDLAQHHVGHNIGLEGHEPPYIDRGSNAVMKPGHVYTIEPGLYTEDAGYRHSDTVAITAEGTERLTYFPRDLEGNIIGW